MKIKLLKKLFLTGIVSTSLMSVALTGCYKNIGPDQFYLYEMGTALNKQFKTTQFQQIIKNLDGTFNYSPTPGWSTRNSANITSYINAAIVDAKTTAASSALKPKDYKNNIFNQITLNFKSNVMKIVKNRQGAYILTYYPNYILEDTATISCILGLNGKTKTTNVNFAVSGQNVVLYADGQHGLGSNKVYGMSWLNKETMVLIDDYNGTNKLVLGNVETTSSPGQPVGSFTFTQLALSNVTGTLLDVATDNNNNVYLGTSNNIFKATYNPQTNAIGPFAALANVPTALKNNTNLYMFCSKDGHKMLVANKTKIMYFDPTKQIPTAYTLATPSGIIERKNQITMSPNGDYAYVGTNTSSTTNSGTLYKITKTTNSTTLSSNLWTNTLNYYHIQGSTYVGSLAVTDQDRIFIGTICFPKQGRSGYGNWIFWADHAGSKSYYEPHIQGGPSYTYYGSIVYAIIPISNNNIMFYVNSHGAKNLAIATQNGNTFKISDRYLTYQSSLNVGMIFAQYSLGKGDNNLVFAFDIAHYSGQTPQEPVLAISKTNYFS